MMDSVFSVVHGNNVWSLKSTVMRMVHLGEETVGVMAVDDGEDAEFAFHWYVNHFHKPENKLLLVHCPETYANVTMMSPGKVQELIKECEAKIKAIQDRYLEKMKVNGIQGEFIRLSGEKPGHAVVECAISKNATFIVTGTRGQSKVRRTIMGSVSDYVIHHSPIPVLVCRHRSEQEKMKEEHKYQQHLREKEKKEQREKEQREKEHKKKDDHHHKESKHKDHKDKDHKDKEHKEKDKEHKEKAEKKH